MLETGRELYINKYIEKNLCVKLDNCQESVYFKLKGEAIDRSLWRICYGIGYRPVGKADYGIDDKSINNTVKFIAKI